MKEMFLRYKSLLLLELFKYSEPGTWPSAFWIVSWDGNKQVTCIIGGNWTRAGTSLGYRDVYRKIPHRDPHVCWLLLTFCRSVHYFQHFVCDGEINSQPHYGSASGDVTKGVEILSVHDQLLASEQQAHQVWLDSELSILYTCGGKQNVYRQTDRPGYTWVHTFVRTYI